MKTLRTLKPELERSDPSLSLYTDGLWMLILWYNSCEKTLYRAALGSVMGFNETKIAEIIQWIENQHYCVLATGTKIEMDNYKCRFEEFKVKVTVEL